MLYLCGNFIYLFSVKISDLVKAQSQQLNKLEHEVSKLQQQQQQQQQQPSSSSNAAALQPKSVNELAYKIEMQLSKLMEQYLKRYENEHKRKLAEFLHERLAIEFNFLIIIFILIFINVVFCQRESESCAT